MPKNLIVCLNLGFRQITRISMNTKTLLEQTTSFRDDLFGYVPMGGT